MPITGYPGWVDALRQGERLTGTIDAYGSVPMIYRAVNLRCDAISSVPFHIYRNDQEVDWPFAQDLAQLIKETERDLLLTGAAFWLKIQKGQVIRGFQKLNAQTVTVNYDGAAPEPTNPYNGVTFVQMLRGKTFGPWNTDQMVYFREASMTDDIGPGVPAVRVALQNAQLDYYLERFITHFFEGGAQPITMVNMPTEIDEAEFQRFKTDWTARFQGVVNAWRTAFIRSPDIKVTKLTPDLNTMMLDELQQRVITKISATLGVPRTMLEASAANYATADSDRQSFWRETIVPRLSLYTHVINDQLLAPLNYHIEFHPDELDVMQADEAARADSVLKLVQAGVPLRGAMEILGYDNVDRALGADPSPASSAPPPPPQPKDDTEPTPDVVALTPQSTTQAMDGLASMSARRNDWALLAKKIERRIKAGKSPQCAFDSDVITGDEVKAVMRRLYDGMTVHDAQHAVDEVKAVDDMTDDERRIYRELVPEFEKRGKAWVRKILRGEEVDPTLRDVVAPVLNRELNTVAGQRIDELGNDIGVVATDATNDRIVDWLVDYVPIETEKIDATTAERIKKVIDIYRQTPGMTAEDVASMISPAVDPARALMIARTEIVRAQTQAGVIYQGYLAERGLTYRRYWITERDDLTCPICGPLDGKPEEQWAGTEPPAHPNCRCATALRLVKE
jgi:HK97 family phage portal protein